MKTKSAILAFLLAFFAANARADDSSKIVVWLNDGGTTEILFSEMPEFTYDNGTISLQNGDTQLSWPLANLKKFTFEDVEPSLPNDIKELKTASLDILSDNCSVYDLSGKLVKSRIRSLSELPKGAYIIKDGKVSIKVVRK